MEFERLPGCFVEGVGVVEGRGIPLLQADFGLGTLVAEEEDVFVCDKRREVLGVLELAGRVGLVIAYPARSFGHVCYCRIYRGLALKRYNCKSWDSKHPLAI